MSVCVQGRFLVPPNSDSTDVYDETSKPPLKGVCQGALPPEPPGPQWWSRKLAIGSPWAREGDRGRCVLLDHRQQCWIGLQCVKSGHD